VPSNNAAHEALLKEWPFSGALSSVTAVFWHSSNDRTDLSASLDRETNLCIHVFVLSYIWREQNSEAVFIINKFSSRFRRKLKYSCARNNCQSLPIFLDNAKTAVMTSSIAVSVIVWNTVAVVICVAAMIVIGVVVVIGRRRRLQLTLDHYLASTVAESYWPFETEIVSALQRLSAMRSTTMFGDVSAFDVFVYKFRRHQARRWRVKTASKSAACPTSPPSNNDAVEPGCTKVDNVVLGTDQRHTESDDEFEPISDLWSATDEQLVSVSIGGRQGILNVMRTLEIIDHLFDLLYVRLRLDKPVNRYPRQIADVPFAKTVCGIAQATAALWPDDRAPTARQVVAYFSSCTEPDKIGSRWQRVIHRGRWRRDCRTSTAVATFDTVRNRSGGTDEAVVRRVRSRLPYVDALRLSGSRFVLADVRPSSSTVRLAESSVPPSSAAGAQTSVDCGRGRASEVSAQVRFIDERLSRLTTEPRGGGARALVRHRWPEMVAAYRQAVDLVVAVELVTVRTVASHYPEFSFVLPPSLMIDETTNLSTTQRQKSATASADPENVVILVRHLVRLMCGHPDAFRRLEHDRRFRQFITRLHNALYGWHEAPTALRSTVGRCRANVVAYARMLTAVAGRLGIEDASYVQTRRTIGVAESRLYQHIDLLTRRRVQLAEASRQRHWRRHAHRGPEFGNVEDDDDDDDDIEDDFMSAVADDFDLEASGRRPQLHLPRDQWHYAAEPAASSPVESELSLYTMAPSRLVTPSPRPSACSGSSRTTKFRQYVNVATADGGSILSSGSTSSPYASLSSVGRSSSAASGGGGRMPSPMDGVQRRCVPTVGAPHVVGSPISSSTEGGSCRFGAAKLSSVMAASAAIEFSMSSDDEFFDTAV
jgi:hypothetical protein